MRICLVASFGLGTYRRYLQICRYCSFMCKDQTLYAVSSYGESTFLEVCYDAVKTPQSTHRTELPSTDPWSGFCGMPRCLRLLAEESPLRRRVTSSFPNEHWRRCRFSAKLPLGSFIQVTQISTPECCQSFRATVNNRSLYPLRPGKIYYFSICKGFFFVINGQHSNVLVQRRGELASLVMRSQTSNSGGLKPGD